MRNILSAIVNGIAALFGANGGPHPIVATDVPGRAKRRRR
jgi:hypothetical protein